MTIPLALHSDRLQEEGFSHGFFTRAAEPDWHGAAEHLGIPRQRLYLVSQSHGVECHELDGTAPPEHVRTLVGDITLSCVAGIGCGVRVADCAPVLLAERRTGAVAAVHSGWRGTVKRAAEAGVGALRERCGAGQLVAAIGPHIEACCFEVGDDVAAQLAASSPLGDAVVDRSGAKPRVDLRRVIAAQLARAGVDVVDQVRGCTMCDAQRFHSYRRDGSDSGRLLAAVVAKSR